MILRIAAAGEKQLTVGDDRRDALGSRTGNFPQLFPGQRIETRDEIAAREDQLIASAEVEDDRRRVIRQTRALHSPDDGTRGAVECGHTLGHVVAVAVAGCGDGSGILHREQRVRPGGRGHSLLRMQLHALGMVDRQQRQRLRLRRGLRALVVLPGAEVRDECRAIQDVVVHVAHGMGVIASKVIGQRA